jgi:hypothetical protein
MRALRRWLATVAVVTAAVLCAPTVAAAADDPPTLVGDTVSQAEAALIAWDKTVIIDFVPSLKELPPGFTPDNVLVASSHLLPPVAIDTTGPQVEVDLGTVMPDLTGLTPVAVIDTLDPLEIKAEMLPRLIPPESVVSVQRPPAGTIVAFGSLVTVVLAAPVLATTPPPTTEPPTTPAVVATPPNSGVDPVLVAAVGGGSAALLVLIALVSLTSLRRRARRRRAALPERVEVHGYPGQVVGPTITANGPTLSVRLDPRSDPGTVTVVTVAEEDPR